MADTVGDRPLVITDDQAMLDDLLRIAAAAGVEISHAREPGSRAAWRSAPVVLLDVRQAVGAVRADLPRRAGIVVVTADEPDTAQLAACVRLGADRTVQVTSGEDVLVALLGDAAGPGPGDGRTIAVMPGCGGAGASVYCAAIAQAGQRSGLDVLLADCDPWGPGLDMVLGLESDDGVRWSDLAAPSGRLPAHALHQALPRLRVGKGSLAVLGHGRDRRGPVDPRVVEVVLESTRRAGDLAVVDLPRHPDPGADRVVELAELTVLVVPADLRGCSAAVRILPRLRDLGAHMAVVVRGPSQAGLGADDVAALLHLPLLARVMPERSIDRDLQTGRPPGGDSRSSLGRAADAAIARLGAVAAEGPLPPSRSRGAIKSRSA